MKKIPLLFLIIFGLATVTFADKATVELPPGYASLNTYWTLGAYTNGDKEMQDDINAKIKSGFVPVALEINPGNASYVAYVAVGPNVKPKVRIDELTPKTLEKGLNELMALNYNPQDVCFRGR